MHPMTFEYYIDINSCSTIALQQLCGQIRLFFGINPVVSGKVAFGNIRWLEIQPSRRSSRRRGLDSGIHHGKGEVGPLFGEPATAQRIETTIRALAQRGVRKTC